MTTPPQPPLVSAEHLQMPPHDACLTAACRTTHQPVQMCARHATLHTHIEQHEHAPQDDCAFCPTGEGLTRVAEERLQHLTRPEAPWDEEVPRPSDAAFQTCRTLLAGFGFGLREDLSMCPRDGGLAVENNSFDARAIYLDIEPAGTVVLYAPLFETGHDELRFAGAPETLAYLGENLAAHRTPVTS